ncbi:NADPH-dependent F420 reductase [Kitasatospora sp. NBC_00315]|uniref:NADPH-dependent F420 reductase n=1 Tax=Kitasatospora sp. NBC_00315 TaxID=2975963 RepID=UPI00324547EF
MRIGILGAGGMADAFGTRWAQAGHRLVIGARDPGRAHALAGRIGPGAAAGSTARAAAFGEALLVAVPAGSAPEVVARAAPPPGTVLIDCTNPVVGGELQSWGGPSTAERIAAAAPGSPVVKAFNLCHVSVWRRTPPVFDGRPLAVPLCGDDPQALTVVRRLVTDLGATPVAGGALARAGLLEATAAFVIGLWIDGADAQAVLPPLAYAAG